MDHINHETGTDSANQEPAPKIPDHDAPENTPAWREPVKILIRTREELTAFAYNDTFYADSDIRSFMPVNAFTSPDALFDEDEYMTNEAQEIIRRLEAKQVYPFEKFLKLLKTIKQKEMLSALDVAEAFYAWGFTGLRARLCGKEKIQLSRPLLAVANDTAKQSFSKKDVTFMNSEGRIYKPLPEGWRFVNSGSELEEKVKTLKDKRTWLTAPIETNIGEDGLAYRLTKLKIQLSPDRYLAVFEGYNALHNTLSILSPNLTFLPHTYWGLDNQETRENLLFHTQIQSLLDYINDIVTVKSNASSYYMYRALSLSPKAATETILYHYRDILLNKDLSETSETAKYINENGKEAADEINALKFELAGIEQVFSAPEDERTTSEAILNLRDKVMNGEINLDGIWDGSMIDGLKRDDGLSEFLWAAMTKLGFTFAELLEKASKINPTPEILYEFILEKKGIRISFDMVLRNYRLQGYKNDLVKNQNAFAAGAHHWCIVTDVYAEPGEALARHIAVRLKTWPHFRYKKNSQNAVTIVEDTIRAELLRHYTIPDSVSYDTAFVIFAIYSNSYQQSDGTVFFELPAGPEKRKTQLTFDAELIGLVLDNLEERFDGTLEISDYVVMGGSPNFLILNALITPYWVCPLFGQKFEVSSLFLAWKYGLNNKDTGGYEKCIANGWMSQIKRNNLHHALNPMVRELARLTEGSDKEYDIRQYCYRMVEAGDDGKLVYPEPLRHPYDIKYPSFSSEFADELNKDVPNDVTRNKKKLETVGAADLLKQDFTMDLLSIINAPKDIEPPKKRLGLFRGLKIDEVSEMRDADEFIGLLSAPMGETRLISYKDETLTFEDGCSFLPGEVVGIDKKYAVRKLTDAVYLAYFRSGSVRIEL